MASTERDMETIALSDHEELARDEFRRRHGSGSTADAVHGAVAESIESGWMLPGARLGEEYLAGLFSVSRTPVREALMRLEAEGLADRNRYRGLVVARITSTEIVELYVVREALDGAAAQLAATQAQALELNQMDQVNRAMREAASEERYEDMADMNLDFHALLAQASHNQMLQRFIEQTHRWVRRFTTTTFAFPGRSPEALDEHDQLIAAIRGRDSAEAERVARAHMRRAMDIRIELESYQARRGDQARQ